MDTVIQNLTKNAGRFLKPLLWVQNSEKDCVDPKRMIMISETEKSPRSNNELGDYDRFLKNISLAKVRLKATDFTLSQLKDFIIKVKKINIQMIDKTSKHGACKEAAKEVEKLLVKILKIANTPEQGKYIFAGDQTTIPPFRREKGGVAYQGDTEEMEVEVETGSKMKINLVGSNFLTIPLKTLGEDFDLDPGIDQNTQLADLNQGRGVNLGLTRVANSNADVSWGINLYHTVTVGDVINTINASKIAGLNAEINVTKKGLKLTRKRLNESTPGQEFTLSEASGTTAKDSGILTNLLEHSTNRAGSLEGEDLDPILTDSTPVSLLKKGHGLTLGTIKIALGRIQRIVDLSSASIIGEIIDAVNNSIPGVIASVNNSRKGISVESTVGGKSLVVSDGDDKKSAHSLGISGSPDILGTLLFLMEGLNNEDREAISKSLEILNLSLEEILTHGAEVGAKLKRLENIEVRLIGFQPDTSRVLSEIEGDDLFKATKNLTNQLFIFQSALKRGAAMIQPTLLDFIG